MTHIGIISDTHGLIRPEACTVLRDCELIIHAGDIGREEVLSELINIAPIVVIRGNVDIADWAAAIPERQDTIIEGHAIHVIHNLQELDFEPRERDIKMVISGHSHKPLICEREGVIYLNPGSAGPRRFKLPIALATANVDERGIKAQIHNLSPQIFPTGTI